MKKILFSFFILGMSFSAFGATFNCQKQKLPGGKAENSNEYLYVTVDDHKQDLALVCGHLGTDGCDFSHYVYVRGNHKWNKKDQTANMLYSCDYQKGWGDAWVEIGFSSLQKCGSTEGMTKVAVTTGNKAIYAKANMVVHISSDYVVAKEFCYTDEEKVQPVVVEQTCEQSHCSGVSGDALTKCRACCAGENEITWNGSDCSCKDANKNFDVSTRRCVARQDETSNCRNRPTPEGRACCDLPIDVAKWDDPNCNCLDDGKEFKIVNGKGQCVVAESNDGTPFVCPQNDLSLFNQWAISCASHAPTMTLITQIKNLCASGNATAKQYNDLYVKLTASVAINCQQTVVIEKEVIIPDNSQARAAIISAGGVLDSIVAGFGKANVWKNAQGEFNTARLASDSIAAVVLGTAGGLITSSVMKKHQVEDGFEDLKCVIGGQPVAGWGDEFRVGIQ